MSKPIFGYRDRRCLAEPIRLLLHFKKVDFEDKQYAFDKDAWQEDKLYAFDKDAWQEDKFNFGLDFPNLPYYLDGDVKITQSTAILRYVARKYGLDGKDDAQKLRLFVAEQQIVDLRLGLTMLVTGDDYNASTKSEFVPDSLKKIPDMLKLWENFIGDKKYLTGDDITYVDFMAYDAFDFYSLFHTEALDDFPKLKAFQNRVESLSELQKYLTSSTYKK